MDRSPTIGSSCLGKLCRDKGHSRVPEPPDMITGRTTTNLQPPKIRILAIIADEVQRVSPAIGSGGASAAAALISI
jgi:hypothetical protein